MKIKAELKEVSDGVYAFLQHGGWFVSNAGLIVGEKFAVVVDSLTNENMAKDFIEKIREVTNKPIRYLINTHWHGDHIWTNHLFGATTICHENCREDALNAFPEIYSALFPDFDFSGAKVTLQDITLSNRMKIHLEDEELELLHFGTAHTTGDVCVYLPKKKVLFCGDLLFSRPCTPFVMFGSISGIIEALKKLYNLNAEIFVPGHGDVGDRDEILVNIDYYRFVQEEAKKCLEKGLDLNEAIKNLELGKFAEWSNAERIAGNLARAYSELSGTPFDLLEATRIMFDLAKKLNSGQHL
ncbi:MAG: MBL fold metallo-hydrolase [Archaeoglobaceae archaeon]